MAEEIGEQQIAEFTEAFKFFDKDGDGMIQTDELDMLIRSLNINLTEMELDKIKSDIDPDNTGNVDLPEFLALMTTIYKPVDAEKELLEAFKVLQGEYPTYNIQALKHVVMQPTEGGKALSEEEAKDLINLVDPNGTKISW